MILLVLTICFIFFLFRLYILTKDDFPLLRKNTTQEQLFNIAFLMVAVSLLAARSVFVITHFSQIYTNPLVFFLFWYAKFEGLSLAGACISALVFITYYASIRKVPVFRVLDFFALSFLQTLPVAFLISLLLSLRNMPYPFLLGMILFSAISILFSTIFIPLFKKSAVKEGTIAMLVLFFTSLIMIILEEVQKKQTVFGLISIEAILFLFLLIFSLISIIRKERLLRKLRKG